MRAWVLALVGVAAQAVGWTLYFVLHDTPIYAWLLLLSGAGLVVLAFALDYRRVKRLVTGRRGQFGVGTMVGVALAFAIVLVVNALSQGHYLRHDFTWLRQFTLSAQTRQQLGKLESPVEVAVVFAPGATSAIGDFAETLLGEYQLHADLVTVRRIDPDISPDQVRRLGVDRIGAALGVVVFSGSAGRRQVLAPAIATEAEHAFTEAILEASGTAQKKVYFLVGHGEAQIGGDYSLAASHLRDHLFQVLALNLGTGGGVPKDAAAVVMAGPRRPLSAEETGDLRDYLNGGGGFLVLIDPDPPAGWRRFLKDWWITIEDGTLVDPDSHVVPNLDVPLVGRSRNGFGLAQVYFPGATAVIPSPDLPGDVNMAALAWTSESSWLERIPQAGGTPVLDPITDREGPLAIATLVSSAGGTPRVVRMAVVGDSDFATNGHVQNVNNADLFVSLVGWLAADKRLVSIDRKALNIRRLILSPEQAMFLNLSSIGLLPLILFLAGGYQWWRRR
jgi:ABC-type uncharacterized transport system involved in gliding motility auxiliary subunit